MKKTITITDDMETPLILALYAGKQLKEELRQLAADNGREKMAQDLALEFAISQQQVNEQEPEKQLHKMLEDYCYAYGILNGFSDEYIRALIQRGE